MRPEFGRTQYLGGFVSLGLQGAAGIGERARTAWALWF
jgi:hypothetical protein